MAIVVENIVRSVEGGVIAMVRHGEHRFLARVVAHGAVPTETALVVELSLDGETRVVVRANGVDEDSGIFPHADGTVRLVGRVSSIVPIDETECLFDVYVRNGPEFFTVTEREAADAKLEVGTFVEVTADRVIFYPAGSRR
ncbi:MAG: hypothetical protein Q8O67_05600 [Deltaproteobacteria bacterium]|nr:hypothetical protein [Deltaproteobacteria bacterium]